MEVLQPVFLDWAMLTMSQASLCFSSTTLYQLLSGGWWQMVLSALSTIVWCRKNQEKQIWMNTHQYVHIRLSGLWVLCQFRKFRISMISSIGRVSNIRSDSCWLNILMLKGSIGNYHHLVLAGLVRVVKSLLSFNPSFRFFVSKRNQIHNIISSFLHQRK